ncbi:MAG: hypothetical protein J6A11_07110 [Lachnospiraceae bacterium]|nr:hypothetical protein [Lachnospiraceae bacterium]
MDNFMDKLAKRFNAGEMIRANAQAEARDMKRLQERTAEYENMMREMRRLNLKNVEVTEQVQQLIQCGIEQFEGYGTSENAVGRKIEELQGDLTSMKEELLDNESAMEHLLEDLHRELSEMNQGIGNIRTGLSEMNQEIGSARTDLAGMNQEIGSVRTDLSGMHSDLSAMGGSVNTLQYQFAGFDNSMRILEQTVQESMNKGIDADALAPIMDGIREMREMIAGAGASAEQANKKLEEHVHRENVRVYRNVQAALVDEAGKKAREMNTRLDQMEGTLKKNGGLKVMVVITMLAALVSATLQVLMMLGML